MYRIVLGARRCGFAIGDKGEEGIGGICLRRVGFFFFKQKTAYEI